MTHKPPLPDAATPPWPATPAPHAATQPSHAASQAPAEETAKQDEDAGRIAGVDKRIVAGVAGIAVGSAAIAAALMFSGRLNRPKSASTPVPPRPTPKPAPTDSSAATPADHADHGDASDIVVN
jgi:hypothetical protein